MLLALSSLYVKVDASHDFDMCVCGRVRTIVAWVQDRSTSSECRERFQAGAFSVSTGGLCRVLFALLSVGVLAVCQWPLGASVFILMHFFRMCLSSRGAGNSSEFMGGRVANIADQSLFTPCCRHCHPSMLDLLHRRTLTYVGVAGLGQ